MNQQLKLTQHLVLTQDMRLSLKMLALSGQDLYDFLRTEAQTNPAVDSDAFQEQLQQSDRALAADRLAPYMDRPSESYSMGSEGSGDLLQTLQEGSTFRDQLHQEIGLLRLPDAVSRAAHWIIDSLDDSGYFKETSSLLGMPVFQEALALIQAMEPAGIGATSLPECLILQLRRRGIHDPVLEEVLTQDLPLLAAREFDLLKERYRLPDPEAALTLIRSLDPRPAQSLGTSNRTVYVTPDLTFSIQDDQIDVELNRRLTPQITISTAYLELGNKVAAEEKPIYEQYLKRLTGIIEALEKRNSTLLRVGQCIAAHQQHFLTGKEPGLSPLTMTQLASELELHVSTISRAVKDKYVLTGQKLYPLAFYFTQAASKGASPQSRHAIEIRLKELIRQENPQEPLSDEQIVDHLRQAGIAISRRTVAKYRLEMNIPGRSSRRQNQESSGQGRIVQSGNPK